LKLFIGHAAPISALCFVGNERLVSGSNDGGLSVWDVTNGHRLNILSPSHDKRVSELCSNQRGTQFASVSWDSFVRIWDLQKARKETEIRLHPKPVSSVAFHPDGFMLVTGCWDGIVRQWNVTSGQRKSVMRGHLSSIKAVAYSADGRYIASCSIDGECRLWNSLAGSQVGLISARISSIYFSPNGSNLASAGNDGRVRVFSSTIGQCQMVIRNEAWGSVSSIVIHPEGEFIIAGYHSGSIRVFDIQNGTMEQEFHYHKGRIHRLGFAASSGKVLISASGDSTSRIYDIKDLGKRTDVRIQTTILKGHTAAVLSCALSKLNMIATGSEDATICFYKPSKYFEQSSLEPDTILTQHRTPVTGLTFNNELHQLISASRDGQVNIWNINRFSTTDIITLTNTLAHCHNDWINDIALSNTNNGLLVTASNDNTLKIWNTVPKASSTTKDDNAMDVVSANVEEARVTLRGHQGSVNTVSFAYGCVVSGSLDNTIRVWSHKGTEITCLRGHTEKITSCDLWVKLKGVNIKTEIDTDNANRWSTTVDEQELELSRTTHTIDKMLVVSASEDNSIRIWRPTDPEQRCVYDAHAQPLNDIVVSNESIVTSSLDKTIRSWQIPTDLFVNNNSSTSTALTPQITEPNSHLDEITSIAVSRDNSLVFTVSRDAYLFIWSLLPSHNDDYEMDTDTKKSKMSKQPFRIIQSIKAHDETILGMALIRSDSKNHTVITGSVDKTIKFWTINNHSNEEKCSIKRLKTESTNNGPVSMICGQYDMPYFVIGENQSFDSLTFYLYSSSTFQRLKTYKTQTCQWPLSSLLTLNEHKHCILTIGSTSNELCSYDLSLIDSTDSKLYVSYASKIEYKTSFPSEWITSIEKLDDNKMFYLGTTIGNIYSTSNLFTDMNTWTKNQISSKQRSITGLCSINNEMIFTSGYDNLIRVQYRQDHLTTMNEDDDEKEEVLGQYPVPAPITQMRTWKQQTNGIFGVVAGDTLGNLYLVQWYSS
jgi:telomerase protein component 1